MVGNGRNNQRGRGRHLWPRNVPSTQNLREASQFTAVRVKLTPMEKKKANKHDDQITIRLPAALLKHLGGVADIEGRSVADVIRRGLQRQYPLPEKKSK